MIQQIGVVGAGQMGRGIAQVAAANGAHVLLADQTLALATAGCEAIKTGLARLVEKNKMSELDASRIVDCIKPCGDWAQFDDRALVIEAAIEHEASKCALFTKLDRIVPDECILASNTSSISITRLGQATGRPDRVIGMHFMNPVPRMALVEVIRGVCTSDITYERVCATARAMGKTVVTSQDYPGFIVNRILMPMINEAAFALMEGVASAEDIDAAMKLGTNQPMGPLELADFIGLDTCLAIMEVMHRDLGDSKYRPCPLLRRLVDAGRLGKKSALGGFHVSVKTVH